MKIKLTIGFIAVTILYICDLQAKSSLKKASVPLLAECMNGEFSACAKADAFCDSGDGMACKIISTYWMGQKDLPKALSYSKRACQLGDTKSCDYYLQASKNENTRAELQAEIDQETKIQRQKKVINTLGAASKILNDTPPPVQQTTNCETKPVYGMDGRLLKYNTVCK